jgi:hypothetical protein
MRFLLRLVCLLLMVASTTNAAISTELYETLRYSSILAQAAFGSSCANPGGTKLVQQLDGKASGYLSLDGERKWIIVGSNVYLLATEVNLKRSCFQAQVRYDLII